MRSIGQAEQLLRGRVDPVHVLVGEQHRLRRREPLELLDQHLQRQLLLALRASVRAPGSGLPSAGRAAPRSAAPPAQAGRCRAPAAPPAWRAWPRADRRARSRRRAPAARSPDAAGWSCGAASTGRAGVRGARPRAARAAPRTRRDLPIPGSPDSSTTWPSPSLACCQRRSSSAISSSRPTSGVRPAVWRASKRPSARPSPSTRQAASGSAKPLRRCGPRSSARTGRRAAGASPG